MSTPMIMDKDGKNGKETNYLLSWAIRHQHYPLLQSLLKNPEVDPGANNNEMLQLARQLGDKKVEQPLLDHPLVKYTLLRWDM